jgi:hypothetical protein
MHVFDGCNGHIRFPVINQLLNLGLFQSCDRAERDYIRVSIAGILPSRYLNQRTSGLKPVPIEHAWISGATISSNKNPILFRCFKGRNWASRLNYLHEFLKRCFFWSSGDKLIFPDCRLAQPCVINAFPIAYIEELPQFTERPTLHALEQCPEIVIVVGGKSPSQSQVQNHLVCVHKQPLATSIAISQKPTSGESRCLR